MPLSPRVPDLAALDLLLSVVELGSLGRAAQVHGISQPSASSRIRYLEKLVGVPVLERTTLGSKATPAGALIVEWARPVLDAATQLEAGIETLRGKRDSQLRVAASQTIAEYLFPSWLTALHAHTPELSIALQSGNSVAVGKAVLDGSVDIGFIESPNTPSGLEGVPVGSDELVLVVAPEHRWARRRSPIDIAELAGTPLVCREPDSGTRLWFEQAMSAALGDWHPSVLLELSSTTAIKTAVASDYGPAVLSSLSVAAELANGTLVRVALTGVKTARTLRAVWPTGQRPAGPARNLLTIAKK